MSLTTAPSGPNTQLAIDRDIPIVVPFRTDHGERERLWDLAWTSWGNHFVITADDIADAGDSFNRSAACNHGVDIANGLSDWDVVIIADADTIAVPTQLHVAVATARRTGRLTIAHSEWVNVETDEIDQFLRFGAVAYSKDRLVVHHGVSSMLVVPHRLWDRVGGYDTQFVGWGFEDRAFHRACLLAAGGVERIYGPVYHLNHTRPAEEINRRSDARWMANRQRWRRYRSCTTFEQLQSALER